MPHHAPFSRSIARPAVLGAAVAAVLAVPGVAGAASVTPDFMAGNPDCAALGAGWTSILKVEPPKSGDFSSGGWDIHVDANGSAFDWTASKGVDAVIVKGGDNSNVYKYVPASTGDTNLTAPVNPNTNQPYGLSHLEFCDGPDVPPTPDPDPDPEPEQPQPEQPQLQVDPPAPPAAPVQVAAPQQFVAAQRAIPASARLSAPSRCVRRTFTVSVSGRGIRSVTFYVNGKAVRAVKAQQGRRLSARIPVTSGVVRIRASVRFVTGATRSTQTLNAAVVRCLQHAVRPQFTG